MTVRKTRGTGKAVLYESEAVIVPPEPPPEPPEPVCLETFTRTVAGGLGTSEILGLPWVESCSPTTGCGSVLPEVTGNHAEFQPSSIDAEPGAALATGATWPLEVLLKLRHELTQAPGPFTLLNFEVGLVGANSDLHYALVLLRIFQPDMDLIITAQLRTTSGGAVDQSSFIVDALGGGRALDTDYYLRVRWEDPNSVAARAWVVGEAEPADWQVNDTQAGDGIPSTLLRLASGGAQSAVATRTFVDSLEVVEGCG